MEIVPHLPDVGQLRPQASRSNELGDADLESATKGFEAIFLRQFLSQSLKPLLHDTPGSQATGSGIYQSMISEVLADNLAQAGKFGFSSMLQVQLQDNSPDGKFFKSH